MVIRQVNRNTFDVFLSEEFWDDWTRVRMNKDGSVYRVDGKFVSQKQQREIASQIKGV